MRQPIAIGAALGMVLASLTPWSCGFRCPDDGGSGEAWARLGGVTLDWVAIPPYPESQAVVNSPRVRNMATIALGAWAGVIALGGAAGGGLGWAYKRRRESRARQDSPAAAGPLGGGTPELGG